MASVARFPAAGKLLAVLIALALYLNHQLSPLTTSLITGDLIFVVLWVSFIVRQQDES